LAALRTVDPVVYVRFASVYQSFDGFEDFKHFIE
jgi:transcriptional regulator NrdR family protein